MKKSARTMRAGDMTQIALSAALIVMCSWLSIPFTVPFTLQSFAVCLIAALFGWEKGFLSVLLYILLGAVGLPVFSGFRSGAGVILGVTGGYIVGFLLTALVIGFAAQHWEKRSGVLIAAMALGMLLCYVCGTAWYVSVYARNTGAGSVLGALQICVIPFLIPDAAKCALAFAAAKRLKKLKMFRGPENPAKNAKAGGKA